MCLLFTAFLILTADEFYWTKPGTVFLNKVLNRSEYLHVIIALVLERLSPPGIRAITWKSWDHSRSTYRNRGECLSVYINNICEKVRVFAAFIVLIILKHLTSTQFLTSAFFLFISKTIRHKINQWKSQY